MRAIHSATIRRMLATSSSAGPLGVRFSSVASQFYRILDDSTRTADAVVGEVIDQSIDLKVRPPLARSTALSNNFQSRRPLKRVRPGDSIDVPYEVTVSHSLRDFWQVRSTPAWNTWSVACHPLISRHANGSRPSTPTTGSTRPRRSPVPSACKTRCCPPACTPTVHRLRTTRAPSEHDPC